MTNLPPELRAHGHHPLVRIAGSIAGDTRAAPADCTPAHAQPLPQACLARMLTGVLLAGAGAIAFSCKAIIVRLAYRYGVDAVTTIMYRTLFALAAVPGTVAWWSSRDKPRSTRRTGTLFGLGFCGYYLASFAGFRGPAIHRGANLERLILYLNPTIVLLAGTLLFKSRASLAQWLALGVSCIGVLLVFGSATCTRQARTSRWVQSWSSAAPVELRIYLVYSGEIVRRLGALRVTGLAHQHCLRPLHCAVFHL